MITININRYNLAGRAVNPRRGAKGVTGRIKVTPIIDKTEIKSDLLGRLL